MLKFYSIQSSQFQILLLIIIKQNVFKLCKKLNL